MSVKTEEKKVLVTKEVAESEVNKWLDFKRVKNYKREDLKKVIKVLQELVSEGDLIVNSDGTLTYNLAFENAGVKSVTIQPRINMIEFNERIARIAPVEQNDMEITSVILSIITGEMNAVFKTLDTVDYEILKAISLFFQ